MLNFRLEQSCDKVSIDQLHDNAFGPGRYALTAYRLREGTACISELSFVAKEGHRLVGSIRLSPISFGRDAAILLGPLAVDPAKQSTGIGLGLLRKAIEAARNEGHGAIILVGDEPYYARVGFSIVPRNQISFPGPVDANRLLGLGLKDGCLERLAGCAAPGWC